MQGLPNADRFVTDDNAHYFAEEQLRIPSIILDGEVLSARVPHLLMTRLDLVVCTSDHLPSNVGLYALETQRIPSSRTSNSLKLQSLGSPLVDK